MKKFSLLVFALMAFSFINQGKTIDNSLLYTHDVSANELPPSTSNSGSTEMNPIDALHLEEASLDMESSCTSDLRVLKGFNCQNINVKVNPTPTGATDYSWTVSPSVSFTDYGDNITLTNINVCVNYTVRVTITGGACDGETLVATAHCSPF